MEKFTRLTGVAAPYPVVNIDTDMIIPKDYLKTIKRTGLGKGLFAEARYNEDGSENPDFVLNKPAYRNAQILVAGDNFGCGSSREHAPWALLDYGFRAVISSDIADIFKSNALKNGLLPVEVDQRTHAALLERPGIRIVIDLESCTLETEDDIRAQFTVEPFARRCLLDGVDPLGHIVAHEEAIAAYETELHDYAVEALGEVPGLRLIGTAREKVAVLSFILGDIHPHDIGTILDAEGVAVRAGHHCAQPTMQFYQVPATVRASLAFYNTRGEIDTLVKALHKVNEVFQ